MSTNLATIPVAVVPRTVKDYIVPGIPIRLEPEPAPDRVLRITFRTFLQMEEAHGMSFLDANSWQNITPKSLIHMLILALKHEDPDGLITPQYLKRFVHMGNMFYLVEKLGEAWTKTLGKKEAEEQNIRPFVLNLETFNRLRTAA